MPGRNTSPANYSEGLFHLLVENVEEYAIFAMDCAGHIVHWNAGARHITGYEDHEVLGRPLHAIFTPEDLQAGAPAQELQMALQAGRAVDERWHLRKDGSRFWAMGIVVPIFGANKAHVGFGKILRDRTDHKQLQETLQQSNKALARSDEQKNRFIATLAHELRNPLSVLSNSAGLLRRYGKDNRQVESVADMIERQVVQTQRLINDLTDLARSSRGKMQIEKQPLDLRAVASHSVQAVRELIAERKHELKLSEPHVRMEIEGDALRLQQVFINLLTNAARYTEPGGRIALSLTIEGAEAVVRIEDNGAGIPADQLTSVFDLFTQAHPGYPESQAGLGIGLALVRELVSMHGGTIQARSDGVGKGSEFTVRLPMRSGA